MGTGLFLPSDYTIDEVCEMEDKGVIFVKFGTSENPPERANQGLRFPYYEHEGKIIVLESNKRNYPKGFTFFNIKMALKYLGSYGDQLIIFDFHELRRRIENKDDFIINKSNDTYQANQLFVKKVISLGDIDAINYIVDAISEETLLKGGSSELFLRECGFEISADLFHKRIMEEYPEIASNLF